MSRWLRQIPNLITALRILLIAPIAVTLLHHQLLTRSACSRRRRIGSSRRFLAKRFGWQSALGGVLDPAADKLLLATLFVVLAVLHLVPLWLMAAALARDLIIVLGALAYRLLLWVRSRLDRPAVSKFNTLCQGLFILASSRRQQFSNPPTLGRL